MKKIVILFAVLMLMTPALAADTTHVHDIMPHVFTCFHLQQTYHAHTYIQFFDGNPFCMIDMPEKKQILKVTLPDV